MTRRGKIILIAVVALVLVVPVVLKKTRGGDAKEVEMETAATALHVKLLRDAATAVRAGEADRVAIAAEGSGLFLSVVCDLRRVHSHIATFACSVLNRNSQHSASATLLDHSDAAV